MKELDRFTTERLESLCDYRPNRVTNLINFREIAALARIALAAKRAEPVAWFSNGAYYNTGRAALKDQAENPTPLYTTPQLNSPEIPKGWIKCSDRMPESQQWGLVWAKWFNQQVLCWDDVGDQWTDFDGQSYSQYQITHWMPLPAPAEKENG